MYSCGQFQKEPVLSFKIHPGCEVLQVPVCHDWSWHTDTFFDQSPRLFTCTSPTPSGLFRPITSSGIEPLPLADVQINPSLLTPVFWWSHATPFFIFLPLLSPPPASSNQFNSQLRISRSILSGSAPQRDHHQFFTTFQRRLSLQTRCQIAYSGAWMSVTAPNRRQHPALWLSIRDADLQQQLVLLLYLFFMYIRTCFYFHCPSLFSFC